MNNPELWNFHLRKSFQMFFLLLFASNFLLQPIIATNDLGGKVQATTNLTQESTEFVPSSSGTDFTEEVTASSYPSTTEDESTDATSDEPEMTSSTITQLTSSTIQSETRSTTPKDSFIEEPEPEQFFKKPIGYITAGVGVALLLIGLGAGVGFLHWRRNRLIDTNKLKLIKNEM